MGYLNSSVSSAIAGQPNGESPVSGGGLSQDSKFSYGFASSPGKRSSMEDFYEARIDGVDGETVGLFGVFDGHGGARAAEYVKQHLFTNLIKHPKFISDTKAAIAEAYSHTDTEFLKSENNQNRDAGSTASTAILVGDRLLVANVGDSRAVISRGGKAFAVSRDHKPDQTDERQRIEDAGGFVMWALSLLTCKTEGLEEMAWRQTPLLNRNILSLLSSNSNTFIARFSSKANPYHVKVGIPEFLNGIGNGVETYAEKLESEFGDLQNLLVARSLKLKKLNVGGDPKVCKHRKLILKYAHKYRLGLWKPRVEPPKSNK